MQDSWLNRLVFWTATCVVSAIPSLWLAITVLDHRDYGAMTAGIGVFVLLYVVLAGRPTARRLRDDRVAWRALHIGYVTRIAASLILPLGIIVDVIPGAVATMFVAEAFPLPSARAVFLTTLVQGFLLHVVLAVYIALIYGTLRVLQPPGLTD